ncbi:heat-inducible transcription repressor HrcA [Thermosporothrix hazakensis]|jgi:heat-inducible transcriptional repressor|uniref:Heat-inducible transcription repressor HrcA n=2 Tax=Thermosporothrix TaxID=768650 RepID=A0A326UCH1_THEHA|nr:heat-inducible transcriptional repressor HrcA [Thermosporothrix hazakensis]PZW26376.1 heat-inducible transcription repressor HrcA [Thermosporothrix hazakensis]BBH90621.1 heat-inducible transcription repressor HrcA [Thermosporothrix sp. COM3]GCE48672.1 heat-inducible transcription repressor HrcA [Thermosporothrix hazakensis]
MTPLSPRKQQILRALVEEYIHTATPVASETLVRKYGLKFSSATVRHELAGLEEANLIYQPHTSAGRVPTDLGYRYFVEHLMRESTLSLEEQRLIRHQFYQVQDQLDQWVRLTASVMARLLHNAAIMTPPRAVEGRLKHFEVLAVTDLSAHVVLVLTDGTVKQQRLLLDQSIQQEELSIMANRLNKLFQDKNAVEINKILTEHDFSPVERLIADTITRILEQHGDLFGDIFYREGLINILEQPEYSRLGPEQVRNERVRHVLEVLEQNRLLPALASHLHSTPSGGVQVIIGGENQWDEMKDVSLVVARYGKEGQVGGLLGVIGPTRMQYDRAIAVVRYMANVMTELISELYGYE